jgi:hypothetical protein
MKEQVMTQRKLNLGDLTVDSFETVDGAGAPRGTVRGYGSDTVCFGETCDTCPGEASQYWNCGDNTHWWQDTCGDQYTCNNHSCHMTGPNCHCNYTDGECTWGAQDTCAGAEPPCPV